MRRGVAFVALATVLLSACRVDVDVELSVDDDGSGRVTVEVVLDDEAAARVPDLADQLAVDDLVALGWEVTGPDPTPEGGVFIRAGKDFFAPDQAGSVLSEVVAADAGLVGFTLTRQRPFAKTTYELAGQVDLSGGVEIFGDDELADLLGGLPVGRDTEALEAELGAPLSELTGFSFTVRLPGEEATANGAEVTADGNRQMARWTTELGGEPTAIEMTTESTDGAPLIFRGVALAALAAFGLLLVWRAGRGLVRRWRRRGD